jgi:L-galactose dehydrogenase/L-glyceraldehyde 3-phosphate reductase
VRYRTLGNTGISVSTIAFGAGPISTLMVGDDVARQREVVAHAIRAGINWFDTAATYGQGRSEAALGRVLPTIEGAERVHVATKVRLNLDDLNDIEGAVRRSVEASLERLRSPSVTLLQLHNAITRNRGDEPTSLTPADVLGSRGVASAFRRLRDENLVAAIGLTAIGQAQALREVVCSGEFETIQVPYHVLNPSAGRSMPDDFGPRNYGNIIADCAARNMGVLGIRVLAGGALAGNAPSPHTRITPFFPLDLYEDDRRRAEHLRQSLPPAASLPQEAIRFALAHPSIHAAIIGFAETTQIDAAIDAADTPTNIDWEELTATA